MQTEADAITSKDEWHTTGSIGFTCEECGGAYKRPILAHIISAGQIQKYYACPRCMAKTPPTPITIQEVQSPIPISPTKKATTAEKEVVAGCAYHFGYLRRREKGKPIPDECLTCSKMVECLM